MKPQKKVTNERATEYNISVAFPFPFFLPSQKVINSKHEPINGHVLECG
jgi:hypothetical protein